MAIRERGPGGGEGRVELQRAPGVAQTHFDRLRRGGEVGMPTLEELEMRLGADGVALGKLRGFRRCQVDRDLARHGLGQLALQAKDVLELTVIASGPERLVGARGDQVHAQAHAVAEEQRRAFEHGVDIQLPGDLGE